jgi:hypothetical protein
MLGRTVTSPDWTPLAYQAVIEDDEPLPDDVMVSILPVSAYHRACSELWMVSAWLQCRIPVDLHLQE